MSEELMFVIEDMGFRCDLGTVTLYDVLPELLIAIDVYVNRRVDDLYAKIDEIVPPPITEAQDEAIEEMVLGAGETIRRQVTKIAKDYINAVEGSGNKLAEYLGVSYSEDFDESAEDAAISTGTGSGVPFTFSTGDGHGLHDSRTGCSRINTLPQA